MPQLPVLRRYYEGPSVRLLQRNLYGLNQNYNGLQVTGVFDRLTEEVVLNFQAENKLPTDGIFGPKTTDAVSGFQRAGGLAVTGTVTPRTRQRLFNPANPGDYDTRPSSADISSLDPYVASLARKFLDLAGQNGIDVRIISAFRSWDDQDALYAQGRTQPGDIVTDAMGGDSYHNWGLAFDAVPVRNGQIAWDDTETFNRLGELGQQAGLEWGGNWTTYAVGDRRSASLSVYIRTFHRAAA